MKKKIVLIMLGVVLFACDDGGDTSIDSETVQTSQMYVGYQITSTGEKDVTVEAQMTRDSAPSPSNDDDVYLDLGNEESLWISTGEYIEDVKPGDNLFHAVDRINETQSKLRPVYEKTGEVVDFTFFFILSSTINTTKTTYQSSLKQSEEGLYRMSLLRKDKTSSQDSTVIMPNAFDIDDSIKDSTFSRSLDEIVVNWSPVENDVTVEVEVTLSCVDDLEYAYTDIVNVDNGRYVFEAGDLDLEDSQTDCSTTISIVKTRIGELDPKFIGGRISAHQVRRVVLTTSG